MMDEAQHHAMRTTLTIDEDVAAKLKAEMRRTGKSMKEIVNEYLRRGLNSKRELESVAPFKVRAWNLKLREGLSYKNVGALLGQIEGPIHR